MGLLPNSPPRYIRISAELGSEYWGKTIFRKGWWSLSRAWVKRRNWVDFPEPSVPSITISLPIFLYPSANNHTAPSGAQYHFVKYTTFPTVCPLYRKTDFLNFYFPLPFLRKKSGSPLQKSVINDKITKKCHIPLEKNGTVIKEKENGRKQYYL